MKGPFKAKKSSEPEKPPVKAPVQEQTGASGPVAMFRSAEEAKGGPTTANVHPSEVESWKSAGWKTTEKEK